MVQSNHCQLYSAINVGQLLFCELYKNFLAIYKAHTIIIPFYFVEIESQENHFTQSHKLRSDGPTIGKHTISRAHALNHPNIFTNSSVNQC